MDWIQFVIFMVGNLVFTLTLWLWSRAENRSDMRHVDSMLESNRLLISAVHKETQDMMRSFHKEMQEMAKDFHGRLCAIEERRK